MSWSAYHVVLRLRGPLHVGAAQIGNVQRTRPYVTGRALWGALTMRLARSRPAPTAADYAAVGQRLHEALATTYFYPTTDATGQSEPPWPWARPAGDAAGERAFGARYLAGYAGAAQWADGQSAAATTLHEIEQILPVTRDGQPVYLCGYLFARDDLTPDELDWPAALGRIQLGGERSYGWGGVRVARLARLNEAAPALFGRADVHVELGGARPAPVLAAGAPLLAHTLLDPPLPVRGRVEPLVGRIWDQGDGRRVDYSGMCWMPGSAMAGAAPLVIDRFGVWRRVVDAGATT